MAYPLCFMIKRLWSMQTERTGSYFVHHEREEKISSIIVGKMYGGGLWR